MDELITWLRAQLDDEEGAARAVEDNSAPWTGEWVNHNGRGLKTHNGWTLAYLPDARPGLLAHIARQDPAATLRRIAATQAIIELHDGPHECPSEDSSCGWWPEGGCPTTQLLAQPYADRPGWREEWTA